MSRASRRPPPRRSEAPVRPFRDRRERSLRTLAVLVLVVLAIVVWQALATRGWQPAPATVGEFETQLTPAVDLPRLHIRFGRRRREAYTYRYQVGAMSYQGREDGAPPASRLTVYYDPADPGRSVVERPRAGAVVAVSALSLALLAVGFVLARRARRRREVA
jgi:hypothetical protein